MIYKKLSLLILFFATGLLTASAQKSPQDMDRFIDALMKKMTTEEKIGQLNLPVTGEITTGQAKSSDIAGKIKKGEVGGLFNLKGVEKIREVQKQAVEESRLGIPLLFGMDVIHGYETMFPIPLGLSCTWDMAAIEESARIAAVEASADGISWTFSPMVDISRDPRWGRVSEGNGEDPFLGAMIAEAMVRGYQGKDMKRNDEIMACVKHFALYGASEAGRDYNTVDMSRQTVQNVYLNAKGFGKKSPLSAEQELELRTEEFMQRRYEFRYNTMTTVTEYRERNTFCFCFRPVTNRTRNSIAMNARLEGLNLWDRDVARYLDSDRIPVFNPIEDFLFGVDIRWDGRDRIRELASRVPCNNIHWPDLFYRWFLNMVAHWRHTDRNYANCTVPLLVGPQAYRKSTFCRNLLPTELQPYYTDRIDFSNKRDAELSLNRFALINMDEFDQNRESQQAFLKHIIQKPVVNTRRPHGVATQELRRYASFIGTSNHKDLLTDTSGSRRYIVIAVTGPIDCSPIDYEQLYAQAIHDIYKGERYWFDAEDEKVMTESNQEFQVIPIAEQLFHQYFRAAREDEEEYELLLAIEILEQVQHDSRIRVSNCNIIQFGRILQRNQVPSIHAKRGNVYKVVRIKPKRA